MSNPQLIDQLNRYLSFLAQDETNVSLLVKISDLYLELDDITQAQNYLNKASTLDREACLGHQGLLHLNQGQIEQAKTSFIEALNLEDTEALRYNLGCTHFISAELESAATILSPLLANENHTEAKLLMARVLHAQDNIEQAIHLMNAVLTHNPDHSEALGLLALLYFDMGECDVAAQMARSTLALNPANYDAQLIDVMSRLASQEATAEEVEELLQISPEDCRLWFALGSINLSQGHLDLAQSNLEKALEIYPEFYDCYIALGWCLLLQDHMENAFHTYQTAAELVPELADAWGGLALCHALKEDLSIAEELIRKSKDLSSECFLMEIAETIYFNHVNHVQAKEHLMNALKNRNLSVSKKLAIMIDGMQSTL